MPSTPVPGALVVSVDFELHWGVRDKTPASGGYRRNLLGVWTAVPATLQLLAAYGVAATWATVGLLLARDRAEQQRFAPAVRPRYRDARFDPYAEPVGEDEGADPLHFASGLIAQIRATPDQEIGTHTFSHYYCLEPGQTRDTFRADLRAAVAIGEAQGLRPRSIVFPRNQHNGAYDDVLREEGVLVYRGCQAGAPHRVSNGRDDAWWMQAGRLVDSYAPLTGPQTTSWDGISRPDGTANVPASHFVRPYAPRLRQLEAPRRARIANSIRDAARRGRVVHIWWHDHNFGRYTSENLDFLRSLLDVYAACRDEHGMRSLNMAGAADAARDYRVGRKSAVCGLGTGAAGTT